MGGAANFVGHLANTLSASLAKPSASFALSKSGQAQLLNQLNRINVASDTATERPSFSIESASPAADTCTPLQGVSRCTRPASNPLHASSLVCHDTAVRWQDGMHVSPAATLASRSMHSTSASSAAQTVREEELGSGASDDDDPFEGWYGDAQLRDLMEPGYLKMPYGRLAYHQVPAQGSHTTGVIFMGGLASNMNGIKATMLDMHARRRQHPFLRFDYRGHGQSSGNFLDTTLGDWYEDTLAMIDEVALPGPHILVGSSIGGWLALKAAAARRERIKGLVLIAPAVDITDLWWDSLSMEEQQSALTTGFVPLGGSSKEGGRVRTSFFDEASDHCLLDIAAREAQVRCPVRILHGAKDDVVPPFVATEVVNWLESKDVHLTLVKDGDHRLSRPEDLRTIMLAVEELLALDNVRMSSV